MKEIKSIFLACKGTEVSQYPDMQSQFLHCILFRWMQDLGTHILIMESVILIGMLIACISVYCP